MLATATASANEPSRRNPTVADLLQRCPYGDPKITPDTDKISAYCYGVMSGMLFERVILQTSGALECTNDYSKLTSAEAVHGFKAALDEMRRTINNPPDKNTSGTGILGYFVSEQFPCIKKP